MQFDTFTVLLLLTAADAPAQTEAEQAATQDAHLAFQQSQQAAGHLVSAGPVRSGGELRGISLYVTDPEETLAIAGQDPAVLAGWFRLEAHPWMVPAGTMSFAAGTLPASVAEVRG